MSEVLNYSIDFAADGTNLEQPLNKDDIIVAKLDVKADGVLLTKEQAESKVIRFYDYNEDGTTFDINTPSTVFAPAMTDEDGEDIVFNDVAVATATSEINGKKIRISLQEKASEGTPTELFHRDVTLTVNDAPVQGVTVGTPYITIGKKQDKQIAVLSADVTTDRTDVAYQWLKDGTAAPNLSGTTVILNKEESAYGTYQLVVKYNQKHGRYRKEVKSDPVVLSEESFAERTNVTVEGSSSSDASGQPGASADTHANENTHTDTAHTEDNTHVEPGRTDGDTHAADPVPGTASPEEHRDAALNEGAHNDPATHEAGHENPQGSEASTGASQPAVSGGEAEKHNEEPTPDVRPASLPIEGREETHTEQPQGDASPAAPQGDSHTGTPSAETHEGSTAITGEQGSPAPTGETSTGVTKPAAEEKHDEPQAGAETNGHTADVSPAPGTAESHPVETHPEGETSHNTDTAHQDDPRPNETVVQPQPPVSNEPAHTEDTHTAENTDATTGKEEKPAGTTETQPVTPAPAERHEDTPVVTPSQPSVDTPHEAPAVTPSQPSAGSDAGVQPSAPVNNEPSAPADNAHTETGSQPAVGAGEHHDETNHTTEQPQGTPVQPPVAPEHHDETTHNTEGNPSVSGTTETQPAVPEKRGIKLRHTNLGILREGTPLEIEAVATPEERGYELAQCQWMNIKDGVASPVAGQNTAELRLVITPDHGSEFYLTAYNGAELVMSEHAKATHIEYKDVEIIVKPETQLLNKVEGDALNLEVTAVPSDHVVFRWKKEVNGQETTVEGGTQNTLHIEPLRLTDAGDYFIEGERLGKVFARRKVSTVEVAPRKVEVPFNPVLDKSGELSEAIGKTFTLTVTEPNATENTVYSWYRTPVGGQPALLPGQNTNILTISDLKVSDAGVYYVEVSETNRAPVRSAAVTLNVIPEPETLKPQPPVPGTEGTNGDSSTTDPYDGSKVQGDAFGYKHTLTNLSVATFRQYAQMMNPASRIDPLTGLEWQIRLYETLMTILKTDSIDVYMEAMDAAVDFFYTYSGSLFAMENRARFLQYATDSRLPKDAREALLELFNVFYTMGNPGGPEDRWDLKEIKDILRNSVAYARLAQYYDRKYKAMKSAEISGRVRNFI
nr:MAG TPA: large tegument protein UL36 [Caudoviricetes sp.]